MIGGWSAGAPAFSGHRDQITAGHDAVVLATGAATPVEAFRVGDRAYGVQFHPEFDAALVETYVDGPGVRGYLRAGGCDPTRSSPRPVGATRPIGSSVRVCCSAGCTSRPSTGTPGAVRGRAEPAPTQLT